MTFITCKSDCGDNSSQFLTVPQSSSQFLTVPHRKTKVIKEMFLLLKIGWKTRQRGFDIDISGGNRRRRDRDQDTEYRFTIRRWPPEIGSCFVFCVMRVSFILMTSVWLALVFLISVKNIDRRFLRLFRIFSDLTHKIDWMNWIVRI